MTFQHKGHLCLHNDTSNTIKINANIISFQSALRITEVTKINITRASAFNKVSNADDENRQIQRERNVQESRVVQSMKGELEGRGCVGLG